tara:strand:- start:1124 stop:1333 length:210 start_codon:yes stop_codon:yes gene_type:complete
MKNLTDELLLLITVIICFAAVVGMKVIYDNEQIKETHNFTCDTIKETSEYVVDDLEEAGCLNLDYLNTL